MPATTFIAKHHWIAEQGLRLDAGAYAGGAAAVRDRVIDGDWPWRRLDEVSHCFYEARFARNYVLHAAHGTQFLTASDMLLADLKGLRLLSTRGTPQLHDLQLQPGWTLMSRSGTIGRTVYVRGEMQGMVASDDVIRIASDEQVMTPGYLFAYLTSAPAQALIQQRTYGSVVQHIEPHHIADLPVPLPDAAKQQRIHALVAGAAAARTEASRLLDEAAGYFDALAGPMPSLHDHARAAGVVRRSGLGMRLDPFHHVGWAAEVGGLEGTPIGELATVSRPAIVKRIFVDGGIPWVSGIDIYQIRPTFRDRIRRADAESANCLIHEGQVLVQRSGQRYGLIGRAAYVGKRCEGWAAGEDLMRVAAESHYDAARIFAFLRSDVGRRAMLRHSYGTSIPHVNPEGIASLIIPPLPDPLLAGATRALALREQADADEERAVREVEGWLG